MKIIKKVTTTGVVAVMVMCNSMAFAVENVTGVVNTETLRLRKDASTESIVLELLSKDDKVDILEEKDGWYKVKFKDYTGYVSKEFITASGSVKKVESNENEGNSEANNNETTNAQGTVVINQKEAKLLSDCKLYMLPLINSNVIKTLNKDSKVTIVNIAGGWAYVNTSDKNGWIRLDKLSVLDANSSNNEETTTKNVENNNETDNTDKKQEENKEEAKQPEFDVKNAYIKEASVNVRSSSSTSSDIVTTLSQNTQIKLVGEENGWYKVEVNDKSGYILKTLVSDKKVEVTSRSAEVTRTVTQETTTTNTQNTVQAAQNNTNTTAEQTTNQTTETSEPVQTTSSKGEEVVEYAKQFLGCRYVYGGSGPSVFDCSGFTMYVYSHFGYYMGHSAVTQAYVGTYVPRSQLQPGDLIIINNESNTSIGHVGMYVGGGNFIHASSGSGKIVISPLSNAYYNARYVTARRIFN